MNSLTSHGIILLVGLALGLFFAPQLTHSQLGSQQDLQTLSSTLGGPQIVEYCFSPSGYCDQHLIKYIDRAKTSIYIMIYDFTSRTIESALVDARQRGVDVKFVMDRSETQNPGSVYKYLKQSGFDVRIANVPGIMHNKVAIIDGQYVIEGSFNYTHSAVYQNAENLVVINDAAIARAYLNQFQELYSRGSA